MPTLSDPYLIAFVVVATPLVAIFARLAILEARKPL